MFEFIKGILIDATPTQAILDVRGVGYKLAIPANAFIKMPHTGSEIMLYTSMVIRETAHTLHGFITRAERDLFEVLIDISGIGPKIAMALLGHVVMGDFFHAVNKGDHAYLCRVPGVGKKTAERLVLEIKDKLTAFSITEEMIDHSFESTQLWRDAVSALINLGFQQTSAHQAVKKALAESDDVDLPTLIAKALKER